MPEFAYDGHGNPIENPTLDSPPSDRLETWVVTEPIPVLDPGLPIEAKKRKKYPIATGVIDYFPDALAAVALCSYLGNQQHHEGEPLHWDRSKSTDEADALIRHFVQRGTLDADGVPHSAKVAWRALALLQKEIEGQR